MRLPRPITALVLVFIIVGLAFGAKTCPNCGASNRNDAKFCKSCGYAFPPPEGRPSLPAIRVQVSVVPGLVDITSTPAGAVVGVDGKHVGTTPFSTRELAAGRHELELTLPEYRTYYGSFVVPKLQGRVFVRTVPAGAEVLLDSSPRGVAPDSGLAIGNLALGNHVVIVRLAGYQEEARAVQLSAEQPSSQVLVQLQPLMGFLKVGSLPDRARVMLDGRDAGTTAFMGKLAPARYQLKVAKRGFYDWLSYADVQARETTAVFVTLERMRTRKPALLVVGLVSLAGGGAAAALGEIDYGKYVEAIKPEDAERYRKSTEKWDMVRNVAAGLGVLGVGAYIVF